MWGRFANGPLSQLYSPISKPINECLVRQVFRNEQRYYELLVEKSVINLSLFPYHLADIITKGLRVTPFNYYVDVLCYLLKHDRSYDTLPNFTAADCTYTSFRYKLYKIDDFVRSLQ